MGKAIVASDVGHIFNDKKVLKHVNIQIEEGEKYLDF